MTGAASHSSHDPFRDADWDSDKNEADDVGNHEGSSAVCHRLSGKSNEISEADRSTRHGEDESSSGFPAFFWGFFAHDAFL